MNTTLRAIQLATEAGGTSATPAGKAALAHIRYAVAELTAGNVEKVDEWLTSIAEGIRDEDPTTGVKFYVVKPDPVKAFELYLALLEFTTPKVKAVAINLQQNNSENPKAMSFADLQRIVSEQ